MSKISRASTKSVTCAQIYSKNSKNTARGTFGTCAGNSAFINKKSSQAEAAFFKA
jgi:hypothetical protein